ncbi:MAG: DUF1800 family protein [Pseudomonadota bacterium]
MLAAMVLSGCGGGGGSNPSINPPALIDSPQDPVGNNPTPGPTTPAFASSRSTARFLTQSTFGPTQQAIDNLRGSDASAWFLRQMQESPSYLLPVVDRLYEIDDDDQGALLAAEGTTFGFWQNAILGADQLRQRMAFALSEILVVSNGGGELLTDIPDAVAYYQDLLIRHALGNYRDLLEDVTYSPAMGYYLTYMGSEKGDPLTGRMPDENYARELMQLFAIGVVELNVDGSVRTDSNGEPMETYSNADVTGLARVFTGLDVDPQFYFLEEEEPQADPPGYAVPMVFYPERHSPLEKAFLSTVIPAGTPGPQSVTMALDHIFAHPNVAPFVARQLIQRLVTSNPSAEYTGRVALAFSSGRYLLPSGDSVGDGRRGDLAATAAAILFDQEARTLGGPESGKIREPVLRFTHWARAFRVLEVTPEYRSALWDASGPTALSQHPYRAPSVFNFFRPGHVAQGTLTGARGLNAPELQIVNASSVPGYANFMIDFVFHEREDVDTELLQEQFDEDAYPLDARQAPGSFDPDYSAEIAMAGSAASLVDHLDFLLTYGTLTPGTREQLIAFLEQLPAEEVWQRVDRVRYAVFMMMTSPDYLLQR